MDRSRARPTHVWAQLGRSTSISIPKNTPIAWREDNESDTVWVYHHEDELWKETDISEWVQETSWDGAEPPEDRTMLVASGTSLDAHVIPMTPPGMDMAMRVPMTLRLVFEAPMTPFCMVTMDRSVPQTPPGAFPFLPSGLPAVAGRPKADPAPRSGMDEESEEDLSGHEHHGSSSLVLESSPVCSEDTEMPSPTLSGSEKEGIYAAMARDTRSSEGFMASTIGDGDSSGKQRLIAEKSGQAYFVERVFNELPNVVDWVNMGSEQKLLMQTESTIGGVELVSMRFAPGIGTWAIKITPPLEGEGDVLISHKSVDGRSVNLQHRLKQLPGKHILALQCGPGPLSQLPVQILEESGITCAPEAITTSQALRIAAEFVVLHLGGLAHVHIVVLPKPVFDYLLHATPQVVGLDNAASTVPASSSTVTVQFG